MQDTFRIGIFTSASSRTCETVVPMLERAAGSSGRPLLAEKDFILTRSHTVGAPHSHVKGGGNTWDTVKPLKQWFKDLSRVFLVDDDAYKVCIFEPFKPLLLRLEPAADLQEMVIPTQPCLTLELSSKNTVMNFVFI